MIAENFKCEICHKMVLEGDYGYCKYCGDYLEEVDLKIE